MKNVGYVVAGLGLAGALVACSTPAPTPDSAKTKGRDLHLIDEPGAAMPAVSDLEAGRPPKPRSSHPVERTLADEPTAPPAVQTTEQQVPGPTMVPEAAPTATAPAPAPAAAEEIVEIRDKGLPLTLPGEGGYAPSMGELAGGFGSHRPGIMIRGGRGGPDDDCDLDRPGMHGNHGVAINRTTPTFGGMIGSGTSRVGRGHFGGLRGGIR